MSVYRVISNYYNDLLNFLSEENIKNNGLNNLFQSISNEKKKQIVTKLSEMMLRINSGFKNEDLFWEQKAKEQHWFTIIYVVMLFVILIIFFFFYIFRLKELKEFPDPDVVKGIIPSYMVKIKSGLSHLIVYTVIFSVFLVFLINISATKKLCTGQKLLLQEDFKKYGEYVFTNADRGNLGYFFAYFGYWRRNIKADKRNVQDIYNVLNADPSYQSLLSIIKFNVNDKDKNKQATTENITGKEIEVYDALKTDIEKSLIGFFDNGNGYINAKKILLQASPILMLKESKRIMNYYYLLSYKKTNEDPGKKQKQQDIINKIVIEPLSDLLISADSGSAMTGSVDNDIILQSEQDPIVGKEITKLFIAFTFLAFFLYPIYIKTPDTSSSFPQELIPFMPQNYNVETSPDKEFAKGLKTAFVKIYNSDFKTTLASASKMDDPSPAMREIMNKTMPLFTDLYHRLFLKLKGNVWFPFNKEYITDRFNTLFSSSIASGLSTDYKDTFTELVYEHIIVNINNNFDVLAIKKGDLIDNMSTALVSYKMNAMPYQNYIVNSVINKNPKTDKYIDDMTEFLVELDNTIAIKKGQMLEAADIDQKKFMEPDEFIETLKNLSYNNLRKGFEVDFYKEVIDGFYKNISDSVNTDAKNIRNIYLPRATAIKLWNVSTTMVIIILILLLVRILMSAFFDHKRIKKMQVDKDCDRLFAERDYKARKVNYIIKLVLPIFFTTFIIAMIIAFRKKMDATFKFNIEIIENNTLELRKSLDELSKKLDSISNVLNDSERVLKFSAIDSSKVTDNDKKNLFDSIKNIVDKYEKCNYIIESAKTTIPFPYPEVVMHGFMLTITIVAILYALSTFAPIKRLRDIKKLNKLKAKVLITDNMQEINDELMSHSICHNEDMDSIVLALKMIFFTFIIMFLVFYSVKIASSANDFRYGLYNSAYFEESRCYEN